MKVHELVSLLQKQDQDAEIGVSMSSLSGWVQGIDGLVVSDDGVICVDQNEVSLNEDEVGFTTL